MIYITKEGDVLDWIVWKHYGITSVLEDVINANPNLTDSVLKAGIEVILPYIETTKKNEVRLWS